MDHKVSIMDIAYFLMKNIIFLDLQAVSVSLGVGSLVWVQDPDVAWIDGEVLEVNGADIKISCTSGKTVCYDVASSDSSEVVNDNLFLVLRNVQN